MKIKEIKVMRGPNYWSAEHKQLVIATIDPEDCRSRDLKRAHQSLSDHYSRSGRSMPQEAHENAGAAVAHLASVLQSLGGMHAEASYFRENNETRLHYAIVGYQVERAGVFAVEEAVRLLNEYISGKEVKPDEAITQVERIRHKSAMGPTTAYILNEIRRRNIPFRQFDHGSLITLGYGNRQKKVRTAVTDTTSGLGIEMAGDKEETKLILEQANFPVPKGILVRSEEELIERIREVRFPLVVKPLDGNHGRGVTTHIESLEKALFGFEIAKKISDLVIVEDHIMGDDYRFLVINYKLVAVARRNPACVTGDGRSTIRELIEEENRHPDRGDTQDHVLARIRVDAVTSKILADNGLTLDSVPEAGRKIILKDTANISAGGTADDVTDLVHPENRFMAERIAKLFNLNICGVDIMATSIDTPITRETGAIIEVNAGPGIRMHSNPQTGTPRDVASPIIDMLYRKPSEARIPVIAVTGTNGKTTTVRLIAHMARLSGYSPGYSTTDGIYIDGHLVYKGDCTGYVSSQDVLFDPSIDLAVLECARGGILRSGLGFDCSDISIVTNVSEDHLGLKDIHTIEEMARVKMTVPLTTKKSGFAILNADDDLVYGMKAHLHCQVALFSIDENNERIISHSRNGGLVATVSEESVTVIQGDWKLKIEKVAAIPLTLEGRAESMIKNILPAALVGVIMNFGVERLREALHSFYPSPALTPGRMNVFKFSRFEVMVDYAHNVDGFVQLKKFVDRTTAPVKTGVIAATGDRRNEDIIRIGSLAAQAFDKIIIRHDKDPRGRKNEEITGLLREGISQVKPLNDVLVISDEMEAIDYVIEHAVPGEFIVVCADKVQATLDYMATARNNESQSINPQTVD